MTKTKGFGRRGWRTSAALAVLVGTCGVVFFGSAGTASAGLVLCSGNVKPKERGKPSIDARYDFHCNQDIRSFSIITNKKFDFFGTELEVFQPDGVGSTESALLQCEGPVPGSGFGCGTTNRNNPSNCGQTMASPKCANKVSAYNRIEADLGFTKSPCKRKPDEDRLKVWLIVGFEPFVEPQGGSATVGTYTSEPFPMKLRGYGRKACASEVQENKSGKKSRKK